MKIKEEIESRRFDNFFDATDINYSVDFGAEIEEHVKNSTLLILNSENYSSRYWCQKEMLLAKKFEVPIIEVDLVDVMEDRKFPYASNIPSIRVLKDITKFDVLYILEACLVETLRFYYLDIKIKQYALETVKVIKRVPEVHDLDKLVDVKNLSIIKKFDAVLYPDPAVYQEELEFLTKFGVNAYTPSTYRLGDLSNKFFMISTSTPSIRSLSSLGIKSDYLQKFTKRFAKLVLSKSGNIIYGGDLREDGYTQYILEEARIVLSRKNCEDKKIHNYIPFPCCLNQDEKYLQQKTKHSSICTYTNAMPDYFKTKKYNIFKLSDKNNIFEKALYITSLNWMRQEMVKKTDYLIVLGGNEKKYSGIIPGVLEEVILAIINKTPVFILGGFGGVAQKICNHMLGTAELKRKDIFNNSDELYNEAERVSKIDMKIYNFDYIKELLRIENLNNDLTPEMNERLMKTQIIDEALDIIMTKHIVA